MPPYLPSPLNLTSPGAIPGETTQGPAEAGHYKRVTPSGALLLVVAAFMPPYLPIPSQSSSTAAGTPSIYLLPPVASSTQENPLSDRKTVADLSVLAVIQVLLWKAVKLIKAVRISRIS